MLLERLEDIADGHVECVDLFHLGDGPGSFFAVPAHLAALVAGLAQRHAGVVVALWWASDGPCWPHTEHGCSLTSCNHCLSFAFNCECICVPYCHLQVSVESVVAISYLCDQLQCAPKECAICFDSFVSAFAQCSDLHIVTLSIVRLLACSERQQSILAWADTNPHRSASSSSVATDKPLTNST